MASSAGLELPNWLKLLALGLLLLVGAGAAVIFVDGDSEFGSAGQQERPELSKPQLLAAEEAFQVAAVRYVEDRMDMEDDRGIDMPELERLVTTTGDIARNLARQDSINPFPEQSAILFYNESNGEFRSWLIDGSGLIAASEQQPVDLLEVAGANLRSSLGVDQIDKDRDVYRSDAKPGPVKEARAHLSADAQALAGLLFPGEIAKALEGIRHLIIVPTGTIAATPFAMLPVIDGRPLIESVTISVAPGLPELEMPPNPWKGAESFGNSLIIGNPLAHVPGWEISPLPGAEEEALLVANRYGVTPLIGAQATKAAVIKAMPDSSVLFFATHGIADPDDALNNGFLLLSGTTAKDSFLTAKEVQFMQLKADLAVLSACQTGLGKAHGAGMIGLSRAFELAGVPRVVMSLWKVNDKATLAMMDAFTDYARTMSPAEALRAAILATRKKYPNSPKLWGGFTLFGSPR